MSAPASHPPAKDSAYGRTLGHYRPVSGPVRAPGDIHSPLSLILSATNSTSRYGFRSTSSNSTGARHSTVVRRELRFALVRDSADYVCIHDVDYLPIWTDYSWSAKPTRLIRYGLTLKEVGITFSAPWCFSIMPPTNASMVFPIAIGDGARQDLELGQRWRLTSLGFDARDGTYMALRTSMPAFPLPTS